MSSRVGEEGFPLVRRRGGFSKQWRDREAALRTQHKRTLASARKAARVAEQRTRAGEARRAARARLVAGGAPPAL